MAQLIGSVSGRQIGRVCRGRHTLHPTCERDYSISQAYCRDQQEHGKGCTAAFDQAHPAGFVINETDAIPVAQQASKVPANAKVCISFDLTNDLRANLPQPVTQQASRHSSRKDTPETSGSIDHQTTPPTYRVLERAISVYYHGRGIISDLQQAGGKVIKRYFEQVTDPSFDGPVRSGAGAPFGQGIGHRLESVTQNKPPCKVEEPRKRRCQRGLPPFGRLEFLGKLFDSTQPARFIANR